MGKLLIFPDREKNKPYFDLERNLDSTYNVEFYLECGSPLTYFSITAEKVKELLINFL